MMHDAPTVNELTPLKFGIRRLLTGYKIRRQNLVWIFGRLPNNPYQILIKPKFGMSNKRSGFFS